jgi:hypothetical protein
MSLVKLFLLIFVVACGTKKSNLKSSGNMWVHPSEVLSASIVLVFNKSLMGGYCSGALIEDSLDETSAFILTAAHCLEQDNASGKNHYLVRLGNRPAYLNSEERAYKEEIEVSDYVTSPSIPIKLEFWVGHDLALLKLKRRPKLPQRYFLPLIKGSDKDLKYDQVWVAGYGYNYPGITLKKYPQKVFNYSKIQNLIWISSIVGNIIAGDSGGPLLVRNEEGNYEVLGVNSFGFAYFRKIHLSLNAAVDVRTKEPWLICAKEFLKNKEVKTNNHCHSKDFKYVAMD